MDKPSPVPPAPVLALLDWTSLSRIISSSASGILTPSLLTAPCELFDCDDADLMEVSSIVEGCVDAVPEQSGHTL
jgi:hypothetical protein